MPLLTMPIKIIMLTIVCENLFSFHIQDYDYLCLDYDQDGNIMKWQPDKQGKRKKKSEGIANIESATTGTGTMIIFQRFQNLRLFQV